MTHLSSPQQPSLPHVPGESSNKPLRSGAARARWAVAIVLLIGLALRVYQLGAQELRGDEAFGYFFSLRSLSDIVRSTLALVEPHPVASYFVQHAWLLWAGHSEFALRFVSAWFGVLAVALLYRLGRRLGLGTATAGLAAAAMAISPYAIWHSQDARMYAISLALTTASTWLALETLWRHRRRDAAAYGLVTLLALHTHYFAAFIVAAQVLFVLGIALAAPARRRSLRLWLASLIAVGILYAPWLLAASNTLTAYRGTGDSPGLAAMAQRAGSVFAVGETVPAEQRTLFAALAGMLVLIGAARLALSSPPAQDAPPAGPAPRQALALLALYLAVPLLASWISALQRPIFNERYLIIAVPPFFLLAACAVLGSGSSIASGRASNDRAVRLSRALGWIATGIAAVLLVGAMASLARYSTDPAYGKTRGWRELAAKLDQASAAYPADQVRLVQNFPDPTLWFYYRGPVEHLVLPPRADDRAAADEEVDKLVRQGVRRIVMSLQPAAWWDSSGIAEEALSQRYGLLATEQVAGWPVQVYAQPMLPLKPLNERFANPARAPDDGIRLTGQAVGAPRLVPGDVIDVALRWEGSAAGLSGSEKVTLQLLNDAGQLVAQTDRPLDPAELSASATLYGIAIPSTLPPGDYRLIVAIYDPAVPGAPRWVTQAGADHADVATLASGQ